MTYTYYKEEGSFPVKAWDKGVHFDENTYAQLHKTASLPFIHKHIAVMPDGHFGRGSTVGSVIATKKAIIPAAVGVDLGCGMHAVQTTLTADDLPDSLKEIRSDIERAVPHGFVTVRGRSVKGSWDVVPNSVLTKYASLDAGLAKIKDKFPHLAKKDASKQLGSLGGGNHFIEVCLDENNIVWVMLHSGSRGIGNMIGQTFIKQAKKEMERHFINLPDADLAYLVEGSGSFNDYWEAMQWSQNYARENRNVMMDSVLRVLRKHLRPFKLGKVAVNCHHNYAEMENHFGEDVYVTRKGAVRARKDDLGIIPASMGAKSLIVRGLGNPDSFCSCSHGAGRVMSRTEAKKKISIEEHIAATEGIECRKDKAILDESPSAYKNIDAVIAAQSDLIEVMHTLKQVVNVKG